MNSSTNKNMMNSRGGSGRNGSGSDSANYVASNGNNWRTWQTDGDLHHRREVFLQM